jgi:hypothetical protein
VLAQHLWNLKWAIIIISIYLQPGHASMNTGKWPIYTGKIVKSLKSCLYQCIVCFNLDARSEHKSTSKHIFTKEVLIIRFLSTKFLTVPSWQVNKISLRDSLEGTKYHVQVPGKSKLAFQNSVDDKKRLSIS